MNDFERGQQQNHEQMQRIEALPKKMQYVCTAYKRIKPGKRGMTVREMRALIDVFSGLSADMVLAAFCLGFERGQRAGK